MKKEVFTKLRDANTYKVQWRLKAEKHIIGHAEFNELLQRLKKEKYRYIADTLETKRKTTSYCWTIKSYAIDNSKKGFMNLYVKDEKGNLDVYVVGSTEEVQRQLEDKNKKGGCFARNYYNKAMKEQLNITLNQAFGTLPHDKFGLMTIVESLRQLIYFDDFGIQGRKLSNVYKADFSSAFPSTLCGRLPNAATAKFVEGIIEPTDEYPFAFYPKRGDMCILNELDSRKWHSHPLYKKIGNWPFNFEDDITILMKPSLYNLDFITKKLYDRRKEDENCKLILNSFIGFLRSTDWNSGDLQPHVALTAYARHIQKMLNVYDVLIEEGNTPILYMTDCILWCGHASKTTTHEKTLGAFVSEFEGCSGTVIGCGIYAIEEDGQLIVSKHQGTSTETYKEQNIKTLDDFINYYKKTSAARVMKTTLYNPETQQFEKQEVYIRAKR